MFDKTHLFEAQTQGYRTYRIPAILCTKSGVLIATAEARRGKGGDWDSNDVVVRRSDDGGGTWRPMDAIARYEDFGPGPISNFVMIIDRSDGAVHALFCHNYARIFSTRSEDDGATWSEPVDITSTFEPFREDYPWRVIGTGPGHGIQLQTGRYIVPLWMSDGSSTEFGPGNLGHRPSVVAGVYSDDHGATWQRADILCRHGQGDVVNPSEALPLELSDGGVLFNIRTESLRHRRYVSISPDGVTGWSEPETDDDLLEPVCMASILRVDDGSVLFVNCDVLEHELTSPDQVAHDRKRLTVKRSTDDCATWTASRVIEPGQSGYSDLTQNQEHLVCCLYEDQAIGREDDTKYVTCARFDVGWILEGEDG